MARRLPQNAADSGTAGARTICDLDLSELEGIVPPQGLAATELLHDVKPDQIVAGLANDEATLVIINSRMG